MKDKDDISAVDVAILEVRMSILIDSVEKLTETIDGIKRDVDTLLRWRAYLLGAAAVIGVLSSLLIQLVK